MPQTHDAPRTRAWGTWPVNMRQNTMPLGAEILGVLGLTGDLRVDIRGREILSQQFVGHAAPVPAARMTPFR